MGSFFPSRFVGLLAVVLGMALPQMLLAQEKVRGLTLTRTYPLEEIGEVTRGGFLGFDAHNRVAVIAEGAIAVLNDTHWHELSDEAGTSSARLVNAVQGADGQCYFGGLGVWGVLATSDSGRLSAQTKVDPTAPTWTQNTTFLHIEPVQDGVYFGAWNGVVYWDRVTGTNHYIEIPSLTSLLRVGDEVFAGSFSRTLVRLKGPEGRAESVAGVEFGGSSVANYAALSDGLTLLSLRNGRLLTFDGRRTRPWSPQEDLHLTGAVAALCRLPGGEIAIGITGRGLFLMAPDGALLRTLTSPSFHRITRLAAKEPGVLWVMTEEAVEKVLYGSPLTSFDQRTGLPLSWPMMMRVRGRTIVSTEGRLYRAVDGEAAGPSQFRLLAAQPASGAWGVASNGEDLLVGNVGGVFRLAENDTFESVLPGIDASHLVMQGKDFCFVIGPRTIAALRRERGIWRECAEQIPNVGYPPLFQVSANSVWLEYGADRVGRLSFAQGRLSLRIFQEPQWKEAAWVNVGSVDGMVVLTTAGRNYLYFDEEAERFVSPPGWLARLLARAPHAITRIQKDSTGSIWATHRTGVIVFHPVGGDYRMDASTFDHLTDLHPRVQILEGNDVWFSGARSLYRVERTETLAGASPLRPHLISVIDARNGRELFKGGPAQSAVPKFTFAQNNLQLWFFSSTYAWLSAPQYEFRLNGEEGWATFPTGAPLNLSGLREGTYRLETRLSGGREEAGATAVFEFAIMAPWYHTPGAYASYVLAGLAAVGWAIRWTGRRARRHTAMLERLVQARTSQLESAMERLQTETRTAATLAERNRLAAELHDSLQQGLCGAMLQLDATLRHPEAQGQIQSRLVTVRNMVSYTRHEVQNTVWDLESPMLEGTTLGDALRKLIALVNPGTIDFVFEEKGSAGALTQEVQHHLLRITQEAITNAVRHAEARRIEITLVCAPELVRLEVRDDGVGFDPQAVLDGRGNHFGLRGIRARLEKIHGSLAVTSQRGAGTLVSVNVPLSSKS